MPDGRLRALLRRLLGAAASLRAAILLLLLISLASAIGAVLPQSPTTPNADLLYRSYGGFWRRLITTLQLDDVFHSPWFWTLLGLFAANLALCAGRRIGRSLRALVRPPGPIAMGEFAAECVVVPSREGDPAKAEEAVRRYLKRRGFRLRNVADQVFADRWRWSRLSPDLVHLSLLVILAGALLGLFREEGFLVVNEKQLGVPLPLSVPARGATEGGKANLSLRVEDFGAEVYPGTGLYKDYWTSLTVIGRDGAARAALIRVNQPFAYAGYSFYQTSYGDDLSAAEILLAVVERGTNTVVAAAPLRADERVAIEEAGVEIRFVRFFTNFRLTDAGVPVNLPGPEALNPAAILEVTESAGGGFGGAYRDVAFADLPDPHWNVDRRFFFYLEGFFVPKFVEVRYTRDPGYPIVWVGFLMMMIGLAGAFYLPPQRLWVAFEPAQGRILLGGELGRTAVRDRARRERLAQALEKELKGGG
jgi:cytochrome c biogenesis protein